MFVGSIVGFDFSYCISHPPEIEGIHPLAGETTDNGLFGEITYVRSITLLGFFSESALTTTTVFSFDPEVKHYSFSSWRGFISLLRSTTVIT